MTDDSYHTVIGWWLFGCDIMQLHGAQAYVVGLEPSCHYLLSLSKLLKLGPQVHIKLYIQEARPKMLGRSQCIKAGSSMTEANMLESCFR